MTRAALALAVLLPLAGCSPQKDVAVVPAAPVAPSAAGALRADLAAIFGAPQFERPFWSVLVVPGAGDPLYALNAGRLMMPASTMKILTAAGAAEALGWEHRFETKVVSLAPLEDGILRGDLIVVGGGDPSISERSDEPGALRQLARKVRDAGVRRIEGGVIGDDDLFDDRGLGDGWTLDNFPYGYSAPVSALQYNEGSVDLVVQAGANAGEPVTIQTRPDVGGLQIDNRLKTVAKSEPGMLTLQRMPGSSRVVVQGQIPAGSAPFARTASVDNPTLFFASAFRRALAAEGIDVAGDPADIDDFVSKPAVSSARTLASHMSPPLAVLLSSMMKVSQNQYAEAMLKAIGGRETLRGVLEKWDVAADSYVIADGSGLSRYNYVTSETLVRVLRAMRTDPRHAPFAGLLPVGGREGTLARRFAGTPAEGKVRAKTGTIDNVRAIAGYVETAGGETLTFSIIANNFAGPAAAIDEAADRAIVRLAAFTR